MPQPGITVEGDWVGILLNICHHRLVLYDVYGALAIEHHPADWYISEFLDHLQEEEVVLGPGVEVFKRTDQHCVCILVGGAFVDVYLACATACRVLLLLGRLLCLEL